MSFTPRLIAGLQVAIVVFSVFATGFAAAQAVVPIRAIRGANMIGMEDVTISEEADAPGAYRDVASVVGQEAKVTLYPGRPILKGQIGTPALVERNQLVKMIFAQGPLNISTDGRVLDRGGVGENVRVMNLSSRQVVTGSVQPNGTIKVAQ
ncbi:MAG: flagellar basal body P-ring formation chaperone FlgA [Pseudomonadota bacterium]